MNLRHLCGTVLLALGTTGYAVDDWPAARTLNVFSENGRLFVRIMPGDNLAATVGFAGAKRGANARGLFYVLERDRSYRLVADVELANPIAPVDALVSNTGHLITFDNWHNIGYGSVVVVYNPRGAVMKAHSLEQLYSTRRVGDIPTSVSSRWWRCVPLGYVDPAQQTRVYVPEYFGGTFVVDLVTGGFTYQPGKAPCQRPAGPLSTTSR